MSQSAVSRKAQSKLQNEARAAWHNSGRKGTLAMATGTGKSKVPLDEIYDLHQTYGNDLKVLLVVPTESLRDTNWPEEVAKWGMTDIFEECITPVCYASAHKLKGNHWHLVILDEAHHLTELNSKVITNNTCDAIMGLTATPPSPKYNPFKAILMDEIAPVVYYFSIEDAIDEDIVADFHLHVVKLPLENKLKEIQAGSKAKPFKTTEEAMYAFLTKRIQLQIIRGQSAKWEILRRTHFIYGLPSKTRAAKQIMAKIDNGVRRFLVFAGSIDQCEQLCAPNTYHSKAKKPNMLEAFKQYLMNWLGVVSAVNEGHTIAGLDMSLVVRLNSSELELIQKIGRNVRFRPGHKAHIIVLVTQKTVDEDWLKISTRSIDSKRITVHTMDEFMALDFDKLTAQKPEVLVG